MSTDASGDDLGLALILDRDPTPRPVATEEPHPVTLWVHPRYVDDAGREHEADYEIEVGHPDSCTRESETCVVTDYLDTLGIDPDLYAGFPEPDHLAGAELAALDGTVRYVSVTGTPLGYSDPSQGHGYDIDYELTWTD